MGEHLHDDGARTLFSESDRQSITCKQDARTGRIAPGGPQVSLFPGFAWAVPTSFSAALLDCRFEEGDVLYDSAIGYKAWSEAETQLRYSIHVLYPPPSSTRKRSDEESEDEKRSVFLSNWHSSTKLVLRNWASGETTNIDTTQGRLYSVLWKGDLDIFDRNSTVPEPPLLIDKALAHAETVDRVLQQRIQDCEYPNRFILPFDPTNPTLVAKSRVVEAYLRSHFPVSIFDLCPTDCNIRTALRFAPTIAFRCFVVDCGRCEDVRDQIKLALWPRGDSKNTTKGLFDLFRQPKNVSRRSFSLSRHGLFRPGRPREHGDIHVHGFVHQPIYRYRLAEPKLRMVPKSLATYLQGVVVDCPNQLFVRPSIRSSKTREVRGIKNPPVEHLESHELIEFARNSRDFTRFKSRHENVGQYLLENDEFSICCELPVWLEARELKDYTDVFGSLEPLTGHIDLIRMEQDGKVGIWDYKPHAYQEKTAWLQVLLYAVMISCRTGISLKNMRCGYFDEIDAYRFRPVDCLEIQRRS